MRHDVPFSSTHPALSAKQITFARKTLQAGAKKLAQLEPGPVNGPYPVHELETLVSFKDMYATAEETCTQKNFPGESVGQTTRHSLSRDPNKTQTTFESLGLLVCDYQRRLPSIHRVVSQLVRRIQAYACLDIFRCNYYNASLSCHQFIMINRIVVKP